MAINNTGAMFKSFEFDGTDSRNFGVYITGAAVYNAPEREVEMISIPNRNGAFALDKGRFENVEVTYPAGIYADTESDFAEGISDLRNFLCSKRGYCRLTDEYNPNEYRMAIYKSGLEVEPSLLKAGEFEITFECMPQRYLNSGDEEIEVGEWGETETKTGDIVTIDNTDGLMAVKSLNVSLLPVQEGSGTPSPQNIRPITGRTQTDVVDSNGTDTTTKTVTLPHTVYGADVDVTGGQDGVETYKLVEYDGSVDEVWGSEMLAVRNFYIQRPSDLPQWSGVKLLNFTDQISTSPLPGGLFISDGYLNFMLGDALDISSVADWRAWLADNPIQLCYELATPTDLQTTPTDVELLTGVNNISSPQGEITIEYGQNPNIVINPTLFDAAPLLDVEGYGTIDLNGYDIELFDDLVGTVLPEGYVNTYLPYTSDIGGIYVNINDTIQYQNQVPVVSFLVDVTDGYPVTISNCVQSNLSYSGVTSPQAGVSQQPSGEWLWNCQFTGLNYSALVPKDAYISCTLTFTDSNSNSTSINITARAKYDGKSKIEYSLSGINLPPQYKLIASPRISFDTLKIVSTATTYGHPTYIDCSSGEAFAVENNTLLSLNRYIDIGTKLPRLTAGSNTITYDNTITQLKMKPRWWKV